MASSLRRQLATLRKEQGHVQPHHHKTDSLLFTEEEAKNIDYETALNLGTNGLMELCKHDNTLSVFLETLLSPASAEQDRMMLDKTENKKLDTQIDFLLVKLSRFALMKATVKVLEYLVRRYLIHIFNLDSLILFALPFHQTQLFVKILKISKVKGTPWGFFRGVKRAKSPATRGFIVERCIQEPSLLSLLLEKCGVFLSHASSTNHLAKESFADPRHFLSFCCGVVVEVMGGVGGSHRVDEGLLHRILPFVTEGLKSKIQDYQASSYMILSQLSSLVQFSQEVPPLLLSRIAKSKPPAALLSSAIITFATVCNTQFSSLSATLIAPETVVQLLKHPRFLIQVEEVVQQYELSKFVGLFLRSLFALVVKGKANNKSIEKVLPFLGIVANEGLLEPVVASCVRLLVKSLYENEGEDDEDMEVDDEDESDEEEKKDSGVFKKRDFVLKVLRFLNVRFPEEVDKGFNAELKTLKEEDKSEDEDEEEEDEEYDKKQAALYHKWLMDLVGSMEPLLGEKGGMVVEEVGETVGVALVHPSATVRLLALERVMNVVEGVKNKGGEEDDDEDDEDEENKKGWKVGLARVLVVVAGLLEDGEEEVVQKALAVLSLASSFPLGLELLRGEEKVGEVVWRMLRKGEQKGTVSLSSLALRLRSETGLEEEERNWGFVELLFDCLFARKGGLKATELALICLRDSPRLSAHSLFKELNARALLKALSPLMKGKEDAEKVVKFSRSILDAVAKGLTTSKTEAEFGACLEVLGHLAGLGEDGKAGFFHSRLFAFFALNLGCEMLHIKGEDCLANPSAGRSLRCSLVLLSHCSSLFGASSLGGSSKSTSKAGLAGVLKAVSWGEEVQEGKKGKKHQKKISSQDLASYVLLFSLDTIIQYLPKDSSSLVLPCHLLFDLQTSLELLRKENKKNSGAMVEQRRVILLSTLSTLYLFLLSPSAPTSSSPLSIFHPQFKSLITHHLSNKFLSFSSTFYTAPTRPVFLTQSSDVKSVSPSDGDWGLFALREGTWIGHPGVQSRALTQVNLFLAVNGNSLEKGAKGKQECGAFYDRILEVIPGILVALRSELALVRKGALDCLLTICHHLFWLEKAIGSSSSLSPATLRESLEILAKNNDNISTTTTITTSLPNKHTLPEKFHLYLVSAIQSCLMGAEEEKKGKKGANKKAVEKRGDLVYSALALVQILLRSHQSPDVISSLLPTIHLLVGWLDASPSASSPTSYFYLYSQIWKEFVCFTIPFLCQEGGKRGTTVKSPAIQNCFDFFMSILNNPHSSSFRFEEATNFIENIDGITESGANVTPITDFSLSGVLCSALTPEVFGCFSAKNKREVVFALAKLGHFREAHPASRAAKEGLERLEVSAEIFAEAVKDCVGLLAGKGSVSASVDSVVPKKRRKGEEGGVASSASVFAGSAAASGLGEEEQRLERVGDVLQVLVGRELRKVGGGVPVLLYSLLDLLSTLMKMAKEGGEQGKGKKGRKEKKGELSFRFVFVMHLCLGCIRSMFMFLRTGSEQRDALSFSSEQQALPLPSALPEEKKAKKSKGALPTAWKEVSGKLFTVEQLVDFFTSSVDVQTNNLALLLIAEIARCYPHTVIPCVLSIFTYMGEETLSREDNYTFMVVQHAIDAIVPAVMAASEKKGCGGVSSAVELFVGAVERIPGHRRLLLFGMLIKVVGAGALHHIILQLLLKGVMVAVERGRGEGEGREGGFEYGKFVIDLCLQFSPLNIARAMTMVLDILLSVSYEGDKKGGKKEEKERELLVMGVKKGLGYSSPKDREFLVNKIKESFGEGEKGIVGRRGLRAMAVEMGSAYFTNEGVLSKLISLEKREDIVLHNELLNLFQFCLLQMRQYPLDESQSGFIDDLSELQASQAGDSDEDEDEDEDSSDEEDDDEDVSMSDEEDESKEEIKRGKKYMSFSDTASFVKAIRNATLDFIEILNELMSISAFIKAVTNLLRHQDSAIRRSALQMLNEKIVKAVEHDMLSPSHADLFLSMVPILVQQIQNGLGEKKSTKGGRGRKRRGMDVDEEQDLDEKKSQDDSEVNIQTALLTLEILARHFGSSHPEKFSPSAAISVECVSHPSLPVVSSAVISFATHCAEMGALALPQLPRMVPLLLELLKNNMKGQAKEKSSKVLLSEEQVMVLMSVLSAMEVLFITIGQFLSPYLVDIIGFLIDPVFCTGGSGVRRMLNEKSDAVLIAFSKHTQTRHVFACVFGVYDPEAAYHPSSLARLVGIVGRVVESLPTQDVVQNHKKLLKFFIEVFDYRRAVVARGQGVDGSQVEWVERECVGAFVKMVVKLNEVCFKPLFLKLLDWACTPPNLTTRMVKEATAHMAHISDPYRARTFLGVVVELASTLKSIFSPFYVYVVDHLLSYLLHEDYRNGLLRTRRKGDENRRSKRLNKKEDPLYHQITLFVLKSFHKLFLFDSGDVVDVVMFNKVVGPLVDMLGGYKHRGEEGYKEMVGGVVQCLVQLAVVVNSDLLWKTLNHNVLNHTRSSSARVRSGAVQVEIGLYDRLGEEFLLLLPESVSYFSELMEDGDHSVEVVTRKLMKKIDSLLGDESIQDYF